MKDLSQMEREFREHERKIHRLKQLEKEFESLNTEGFESEASAIKPKLKDPAKVGEIETDLTTLKNKINEMERQERKRKEALDAINVLNSKIKKAEKIGITISRSAELASSAFDREDYDNAIGYANKGKEEIENKIGRYEGALNQIKISKSAIDDVRRFGFSVKVADDLIKDAESKLRNGNCDDAVKIAKKSEEESVRIKEDYEARKEASKLISSVEYEMKKIKNSGVKILGSSENLIKQAKAELNKNNFEKAKKLANEARKTAFKRKESYNNASESISSTNKVINNIKSTEIDVPSAEELLSRARSSLDRGKYEEAFELSKQSEEDALRLKREYEAYREASGFVSSAESGMTTIRTSGVKIPEALRLIGRAKAELNRNNFERAKELADEAKSVALERKESCEKALRSISSVDVMISDAKGYGMIVSNAEEVLKNARGSIEEGDYERAYSLSREAERIAKETDTNYKVAKERINSAGTTIKKLKEFCDVAVVKDILNKANFSFGEGIYEDAIEYAKQAEKTAKRLKEVSKPEIEVNLPEKSFKPNYWKTLNLIIMNRGTAHAKGVKINFSREVEVKRIDEFDINSNEEKEMSIVLKPVDQGDVPVDVKISYSDSEGKKYAAEKIFMINVGEVERGDAKSPAAFTPKPTGASHTQFTTFRTVWDPNPGNRDFVWSRRKPDEYGELPGIKQWISDKNPNIYWFLLKIVNRADYPVTEWNVTLYTEQALMITKAHLDDKRVRIVDSSFDTNKNRNKYVVSIPPELGVSIPAKGGTRLMYFETDIRCEDALKMEFGVSGVVKLGTTPQIEVPIREKRFTYACKYGDFKKMFYGSIDALASQVMENLQDSYMVRLITSLTSKSSTHRLHSKCTLGP